LAYLFGVYYVDGHITTPQKGTEFKNIFMKVIIYLKTGVKPPHELLFI
jgi:hypothetical protein